MGCGASAAQEEPQSKQRGGDGDEEPAVEHKASKEPDGSPSDAGRSQTKKDSTFQGSGSIRAHGSPQQQSLSPGSTALTGGGLSQSFASVGSGNVAITMPVHVITDSTGHRVQSCISSRSKVEVVTRWCDHIMRHRPKVDDEGVGGWRNPQEDAHKEKTATSANGSMASFDGKSTLGTQHEVASTSQLSLGINAPPSPQNAGSFMSPKDVSVIPNAPNSPRHLDDSSKGLNSPAPNTHELHKPRTQRQLQDDALLAIHGVTTTPTLDVQGSPRGRSEAGGAYNSAPGGDSSPTMSPHAQDINNLLENEAPAGT